MSPLELLLRFVGSIFGSAKRDERKRKATEDLKKALEEAEKPLRAEDDRK